MSSETWRDYHVSVFGLTGERLEDNVGKKHELPGTLSPNSLNLAWDLRTSEHFRYSDREKENPSFGYTDYLPIGFFTSEVYT